MLLFEWKVKGKIASYFFVYYGLKSSIFVEVDDLRTTGSKKRNFDFRTGRIISFTKFQYQAVEKD